MTDNLFDQGWYERKAQEYTARVRQQKEEERKKAEEERNKGKGKPEIPQVQNPQLSPVRTSGNLDLSKYIQIPDSNILISIRELYKRSNWTDSHFKLAENGLFMPTPAIAMNYVLKVRDASQRKRKLFYADGRELNEQEVQDLWAYLSKRRNGAWSWLNAMFGENTIKSVESVDLANKRLVFGKENPLEACVNEDCFVDLEFNSQGMPTKRYGNQEYSQGQNAYFCHPRNGGVARLGIESDWLFLSCYGDPTNANVALGVFGCAEGGSK